MKKIAAVMTAGLLIAIIGMAGCQKQEKQTEKTAPGTAPTMTSPTGTSAAPSGK